MPPNSKAGKGATRLNFIYFSFFMSHMYVSLSRGLLEVDNMG
jgi:hypothetical protein